MAENQQKPDDREKKAKNHKIQVDLSEISMFGAEIWIQGRSNYAKISTFFFRPPSVTTESKPSHKAKKKAEMEVNQ